MKYRYAQILGMRGMTKRADGSVWDMFVDNGTSLSAPSADVYDAGQVSKYNNVEPIYRTVHQDKGPDKRYETGKYRPVGSFMGGSSYNENYSLAGVDPNKTNQHAVIMIGGAMDREGAEFANMGKMPKNKVFRFRYVDERQAEQLARDLAAKGVQLHIFGHSRGGDVADRIGERLQKDKINPDVHLFDPVRSSVFRLPFMKRRVRTSGAHVYVPSNGNTFGGGFNFDNLVANIGGKFTPPADAQTYDGTHVNGVKKYLNRVLSKIKYMAGMRNPADQPQVAAK